MARINTDRPEAMVYRGQDLPFVRKVTADDGAAFTEMVDQVIVRGSNGGELYFYANEVELSDDEKKATDKTERKAKQALDERKEAEQANTEGKKKLFAGTKAGAKADDEDKPNPGTGGIASPDIPAHQGTSGAQMQAETNRFNRVPGEPPRTEQGDGASGTGIPSNATDDESRDYGRSGYPEGSGPDPQGQRVNEKDQSHSGTVERPAPPGGDTGPQE